MSALLPFSEVPKHSMPAPDCRNLFCAGKQPRYSLKGQCLPGSLAELPRADPSCPPWLPWGTFAGYSWPGEVGKPWLDLNASQTPAQIYFWLLCLSCASSSCSKHGRKGTRAGAGLWLGAQGKCEPGEEPQSQDCSSREPLPRRDGAPEGNPNCTLQMRRLLKTDKWLRSKVCGRCTKWEQNAEHCCR